MSDTVISRNEFYIIGNVPFVVRSIDRVYMDKDNGLTVAFTAQTLDTHDVYYDHVDQTNAHEIQYLRDVLDKAYPDGVA
jgi:hypothetical protein